MSLIFQIRPRRKFFVLLMYATLGAFAGCSGASSDIAGNKQSDAEPIILVDSSKAQEAPVKVRDRVYDAQEIARFEKPWEMSFVSDRLLLVTTQPGKLFLLRWPEALTGADRQLSAPESIEVTGVPEVSYQGQGGLGDIIAADDFLRTGRVFLSYVEVGTGPEADKSGAVVVTAVLKGVDSDSPELTAVETLWQQVPKMTGDGHFSQKLLLSQDNHLFITSGERQKFDPAQNMAMNLGKVVRLMPDGELPQDNPFSSSGELAAQFWTIGHRNLLGIAQSSDGRIWTHEMGPRGGDELNLLQKEDNYGYPVVSNGKHYNGDPIPDHATRPEFNSPELWWDPVISPSDLISYSGSVFPDLQGKLLVTGLSSQSLHAIDPDASEGPKEISRTNMGRRMRSIAQGPDEALWVLEDGSDSALLRLVPLEDY